MRDKYSDSKKESIIQRNIEKRLNGVITRRKLSAEDYSSDENSEKLYAYRIWHYMLVLYVHSFARCVYKRNYFNEDSRLTLYIFQLAERFAQLNKLASLVYYVL